VELPAGHAEIPVIAMGSVGAIGGRPQLHCSHNAKLKLSSWYESAAQSVGISNSKSFEHGNESKVKRRDFVILLGDAVAVA
jgi:hypothetical protein